MPSKLIQVKPKPEKKELQPEPKKPHPNKMFSYHLEKLLDPGSVILRTNFEMQMRKRKVIDC